VATISSMSRALSESGSAPYVSAAARPSSGARLSVVSSTWRIQSAWRAAPTSFGRPARDAARAFGFLARRAARPDFRFIETEELIDEVSGEHAVLSGPPALALVQHQLAVGDRAPQSTAVPSA